MNKNDLLSELSEKLKSGEISKEDLIRISSIQEEKNSEEENSIFSSKLSMTKIFYIIGSVIVTAGVVFFIAQIWDDIGSFLRIFITLGFGFVFAFIGSTLVKKSELSDIGQIFHLIGGILIPIGFLVFINEMSLDNGTLWPFVWVFLLAFLIYFSITIIQKKTILTFFTIINGTIFTYLLIFALIENLQSSSVADIIVYLTMTVGISYLVLAHYFINTWNKKLVGFMNFFGSGAFLGASFSRVFDSGIWQVVYFLIVFMGIYLAIELKSRAILFLSTIFLISHITYITSKYFADSLGWPITLIFLGFIFIGLGYFSLNISKNYIKK
ncbi:DUF2157 domain-containing protein [bacterium]|nr:DUF2157 domain-containing protein [bacterium]